MIVFPNAKINLGLRVVARRGDGYHDIESLFLPVGLADALEITPSVDGRFSFSSSGIAIGGDVESNLCVKAFRLMQRKFNVPALKIFLHKMIPHGAGLGGGSSDAAFTLKLINRMFSLKICNQELKELAAELGSDCPFFIENRPCLATGRGEHLQPLDTFYGQKYILVVKPDVSVSTAWAYGHVIPSGKHLPPLADITVNPSLWNSLLPNDFENAVFDEWPEIGYIKQQLLQMGAVYAAMSGSGSAVFGLFDQEPEIAERLKGLFVWSGKLMQ
ncbi:MAG TPA: 4-(cytidine 5'-diphospho)-2-C-methyl-D-erythritol kinase [Lentimicrobium sp.]|nr:4-(cytidine 5'-diphospho)-2-C-methyl-D-erythritol kinase [Lentimicrobium sp.]